MRARVRAWLNDVHLGGAASLPTSELLKRIFHEERDTALINAANIPDVLSDSLSSPR